MWDGVPGKQEEIRGTLKELWRHHTPPQGAAPVPGLPGNAAGRAGGAAKGEPGRRSAVAGPEL